MEIAEVVANCIRALNDIHVRGYEDLKRMLAVMDTLRSVQAAYVQEKKQKEEVTQDAADNAGGQEA